MKTGKMLVFAMMTLLCCQSLFAQGFQPPAEGKAVVYFTRVSSYGYAVSFEYFHNDEYIGVFKGKNYMRYECEPGKHLFWASSENKEFIEADLAAGGTYIVMVNIEMGAWKARVGLSPITDKNTEEFTRAKDLIFSEPPSSTPQKKVDEMNVKLKDFIADKLKMYDEVWKSKYNYPVITQDMAIPAESMK